MELDTTNWSGEGAFTQALVDALRAIEALTLVRVEDAPATRTEADYNFVSNELFVTFASRSRTEPIKRFGVFPGTRVVEAPVMTLSEFEATLSALDGIGAPDYGDDGMLQYLRTERIIPAYQTRGYKLVELVRIYEAGTPRRE